MSTLKVDTIATRTGSGNITVSNNAVFSGDLAVDTNVLKVDSTNNKVGINVTSPDAMLQVQNGDITVGWADNFIGAQFQTGSDFRLGMKFGTVARTTKIVAETNDNNGEITFETNGSERARISNAGLHLGGTGAANALDDYEEGTWTPVITGGSSAGSGTYSTQTGTYTKIGRLFTFTFALGWTNHTGSGHIQLGGFPFTPTAQSYYLTQLEGISLTSNNFAAFARIEASSNTGILVQSPVGGGNRAVVAMDTTGYVNGSGTFTST